MEVNPEHLRVIQTNLPVPTTFLGLEPYAGDWSDASLYSFLKELEQKLSKIGNKASLARNRMLSDLFRIYGKENVRALKRENYNIKLEDFVVGGEHGWLLDIVDSYIVPRAGFVYLTPRNNLGRAPFYSSEKILGPWHIKTLWFNMAVLLLMSLIVMVLLYNDCPGRFIRKDQ